MNIHYSGFLVLACFQLCWLVASPKLMETLDDVSMRNTRAGHDEWTYYGRDNGPAQWPKLFSKCNGKSQSPVPIIDSQTTTVRQSRLTLLNYGKTQKDGRSWVIKNIGPEIVIEIDSRVKYLMSGGGLQGTFALDSFHYHVGSNNRMGSEHTLNGRSYAMELHLVHHNTKYTKADAANHHDGLAVLGILFQVSPQENMAYRPLVEKLKSVRHMDKSLKIHPFNLRNLLPAKAAFYRYQGSLTTPPCSQSVIWTVFANPVSISQKQINEFRSQFFNKAGGHEVRMLNNFRPIQKLNGRKVLKDNHASPIIVG